MTAFTTAGLQGRLIGGVIPLQGAGISRNSRAASLGAQSSRPRLQLACGAAGLVQFMGRTPGRDEKHGLQPLWLLDVSHNLRPRRRRLDPSRADRARRRRNLLERDSAAEAGPNFRIPSRRGRGAGTRDARRRQLFQRSGARTRIWRRLVRRQRRRGPFKRSNVRTWRVCRVPRSTAIRCTGLVLRAG